MAQYSAGSVRWLPKTIMQLLLQDVGRESHFLTVMIYLRNTFTESQPPTYFYSFTKL